jgi:hypothetical protein
MEKHYRIVFAGQLQPGFERAQVEAAATTRLRLTDTQREQMFSGRNVTLKRALAGNLAQRYLAELHRIGLAVHLVEEAPATPVAPVAPPAPADAFDPEKTLVASPAALNAYLAAFPEPAASAPVAAPTAPPAPAAPPIAAPPVADVLRPVPMMDPSVHSAPTVLADMGDAPSDTAAPALPVRPWLMVAGALVVVVAVLWIVL